MSLIPANSASTSMVPFSLLSRLEEQMADPIKLVVSFLSFKELAIFEVTSKNKREFTAIQWKNFAKSDSDVFKWWASEGTGQRDKWNYCLSKILLNNVYQLATKSFGRPFTLSRNAAPFYGLLEGASMKDRGFDNHEAGIGNALSQECTGDQGNTGEIFLAGLLELRQYAMEPYPEGLEAIQQQMNPAITLGVRVVSQVVIDTLSQKENDPLGEELLKLHSNLAIASANKGDFLPLEKIISKVDVEFLKKHQVMNYPPVLLALSSHYIQEEDYEQAWEIIARAMKLVEDNPPLELLQNGVIAASNLRKWKDTLTFFHRIPPKDLLNEDILLDAAKAYKHSGKWIEAETLLLQIIKGYGEAVPSLFQEELAKVKLKKLV